LWTFATKVQKLFSNCKLNGVKSVDWYVAPLLNPDGYEYTFTSDRLWRKNMYVTPAPNTVLD
jgi:hypothetical protein